MAGRTTPRGPKDRPAKVIQLSPREQQSRGTQPSRKAAVQRAGTAKSTARTGASSPAAARNNRPRQEVSPEEVAQRRRNNKVLKSVQGIDFTILIVVLILVEMCIRDRAWRPFMKSI